MFTLTTKAEYGITALLELAGHYDRGLMQIGDISRKHGIPQNYLEQIFNRLIRGKIVKAVRGKKGGYILMESPEKITLLQCLECLEGEVHISDNGSDNCVIRKIYSDVEKECRERLSVFLADLLPVHQSPMFYI